MDEPVRSFRQRFKFRLSGKAEWKVFLSCFLLAVMLWFLTALNESYVTHIKVKINYTNIPKEKVYSQPLPKNFKLLVNANGWDLLRYRVVNDSQEINIDLEQFKNKPYIITSRLKEALGLQLAKTTSINDIYPDTIDLSQENILKKAVPIQLQLQITFDKEYNLGLPISISPDSVVVSGPYSEVQKIHNVYTQDIQFYKLNHPVKQKIKLDAPPDANLTYGINEVELNIPTYQLTEKTLDVPVEVINKPTGMNVIVMPRSVKITFQTPINQFDKIIPEMFQASVDGSSIDTMRKDPLKINLLSQPQFSRNVRIEPEFVNFAIQR